MIKKEYIGGCFGNFKSFFLLFYLYVLYILLISLELIFELCFRKD